MILKKTLLKKYVKQAPRLCSIGIRKMKFGKLRKTLNSHLGNSAVSYGSSLALNKLII